MLAVLFLVAGTARGQGVGASGDIRGTVTDPTGAVVSKATVTVTDAEKGIKRSAVTDPDGEYRFTALPPTTYDISVQFSGFQTYIQKGVVVNVGQTVTLDFHLTVSRAAESVEVTTEAPVVDTQQSAQANVIDTQTIQDLPINRRDYLTFSLLAPAVTDSTRLAGDQDFRVKQTPQSGLSFYGSNGRGNSVTVDGGEVNDDAGGVRLTLSSEAVQEFQINRSNYGPDLGGASGASINIVSKSGSNQVHGTVFGLFRNDAFDERNPFAFTQPLAPGATFNPALPDVAGQPTQDSLSRYQFGGSVGFPISRDKTFAFVAAEGLISNAQNAVPLFTNTNVFRPTAAQQPIITGLATLAGNPAVPCLTGQPALPAATCAVILTSIFTINPAAANPGTRARNQFLINQFEANGGLFAYDTREYFISGRLDHQFSERNQAYLRYSFAHDNEQSPDVQSLVGFSAGSSIAPAYDNTLQIAWFHQFSPRTLNEARVQWNYSHFDVIPNAPGTVGLNMPGFGFLNSNIFLPSKTIMRRYEFADNFSMVRGHHSLKFGGYELIRGNHTESDTFFPGRFQFGSLPGGIVTPCFQVPAACGLTGVNAATISSLQSFSLGLPQFYQQGFGSAIYAINRPWTAFFASDSWSLRSNFTFTFGVRYELDSQYGRLKTDTNNFAPRIAFAWDPFSDHKMAVRGGYGIFYSSIYGQIPNVIQTLGLVNGFQQIAQVFVPLTGEPGNPALTSAAIFQTLFAQGKVQCTAPAAGNPACITPADLAQFGITIKHDGTAPLSVFFSGQPNYQNPYSQQAELSVERQIGKSFSVSVSGVYVHTIGLPTSVDGNALPAPITNVPLANGSIVSVRNWNSRLPNPLNSAPCAGATIVNCFVSPTTLQNNFYSSRGAAIYEGGILEIKKRFSDHMSLMFNYTFSKAFSSSTDFNSDFGPQDNTNLVLERGLSDFDQRHKLVIAAVLESPWKNRFFSGFQVAPIVRYNSGHPFNLLAGTDVNGDRHSTNDRPIGVAHNTGVGPDFATFDMRVTKRFKFTEKTILSIIAEGFNIFNQINYASVNNVVSPNLLLPTAAGGLGFTTANLHGSSAIAPNQPLGFTSAFPTRQLQLGAKLTF
ncbi:MAG TPA: carboxypeptidase regulatory-like domain-containing protein [Candidatus Acidoferrum sp.]|nr:carboxypeptidase regulatory-like domain-containing protein [Candidatus Acidoferrum sp.]